MIISVMRIDSGYSVTLQSLQSVVQGEVYFKFEADAIDFAELWRDWVGAATILTPGNAAAPEAVAAA